MPSKADKVRALKKTNPDWTYAQIAKVAKCSVPYISQLLGKKRGKKTSTNNDDMSELYKYILKNGGIAKVRKELESLKESPAITFAISQGGLSHALPPVGGKLGGVGWGYPNCSFFPYLSPLRQDRQVSGVRGLY